MENKVMTILEQAMAYHVNGYNLIPVNKDKTPALKEVVPQRTADQTDEQILEWFKDENKNIGIITGKKSGIIVIDIDTYNGGKDIFPDTFTVKTGNGGTQKYYQYIPGFTISANGYSNMPFIDIRADGGYVVAPPSITDYVKDGKKAGGQYEIINNIPLAPFPNHLFPKQKEKRKLSSVIAVSTGGRNDSIASFIGKLLKLEPNEKDWSTEVWSAAVHTNKTYSPPLSDQELKNTFDSIVKKELERRKGLIVSLFQTAEREDISIPLRKSQGNIAFRDMANVVAVLEHHPYYKDTIRFNTFAQEIEYHKKPLEDSDINKIQYFLQTTIGLSSIGREAVFSAIVHVAQKCSYDEAQEWLKSLVWDGTPRLNNWLNSATGVTENAYHQGIGSQWFMGMVRRIMIPGCIFDHMLVLTGDQGLGKTSLFRIIGGPWYKAFTGSVENKDFYLALRKAIIIDLDEGATLYKSEAIKIKSIITCTEDEFRAPYERVTKKYPRRFVFSMSTNDLEPFRDTTGNRRYWAIDIKQGVNFKWLEENRDQLFAETYHYFKEKTVISEVPLEEAQAIQEAHLPDDSWTELVGDEVRKSFAYVSGDPEFSTTIMDVYKKIFPDETLARLGRSQEMRVASIFKKELGLEKVQKMIDGERKNRWYITKKKMKELREKPEKKVIAPLDDLVELLKEKKLF